MMLQVPKNFLHCHWWGCLQSLQAFLPKVLLLHIPAIPLFLQGRSKLCPMHGMRWLEHFCNSIKKNLILVSLFEETLYIICGYLILTVYGYLSWPSQHIWRRLLTPPCFAISLQRWFPSNARLISWSIESLRTTADFLSFRRSTLDCN